jgi:hypothetical protein
MKEWLSIILGILKLIFGRKEPTERDKTKKRIKELNREIRRNKKEIHKAVKDTDYTRYEYYLDKLQQLKARRKELQGLLCK